MEEPQRHSRRRNRKRVESVIKHYGRQTETEAIDEVEATAKYSKVTLVGVPNEPVKEVEELIARRIQGRKSA